MAKTFSFEEALQPVSQQPSTFSFEEAMKPVAKQPTTFSFEEALKPTTTLQGEQDEFKQAQIKSAKQQEVAAQQPQKPEEKAKEEKHWYDFLTEEATARHDIAKKVGEDVFVATKNTPTAAKAAVAAAIEGSDPNVVFGEKDWKDSVIEDARKKAKEVRAMPGGEDEYMLGITREKLRNLPQNLSFSLVSMGAGLVTGIPAAFAATPIAGYLAGGGASGLAAYRMDTNGFLRDLRDHLNSAAEKTTGKPLTDEQFIRVSKNYENLVKEHGLWEALPEAFGNVLGAKIGSLLFKEAAPGIKGLLLNLAQVGGQFTNELATETVTQTGQHNVEVDTGMSNEPKRSLTDYDDLKKSAKEVLPDVLLLTGVTTGGAKAAGAIYRGTDYAKNREFAQAMQGDIAGRNFTQQGIQREASNRLAGVKPTEMSDIAKSIEDRDAGITPPVAPPEPPEETAQAQPTTFSEDNLIAMGIGKTNKKLREALIGKDLSNPDERAEVQTTLQTYRDRPKLSEGIRTKVDAFLSSPVMTSDISAVTPAAIEQTLAAPKVEAIQVDSLEGDKSEVEMDVGKAYAAGKGVPVASPLGQLNVVALVDPNDNGELFIHDDSGEVVGSVFFTKDEAPDGTRFEPVFTIDDSYRDKEFDAAIYDLMHSLGAVTPKQEEVITAEPAKAEDLVPEFKKLVFDFAQEVHDRGEPLAQGAFFNILDNWLSDNPEIAQAQSRGEGRNEVIDKAAEVFNNRLKELQEQTEPAKVKPAKIQSTLNPETIDEILAQDKDDLLLRSFVISLHEISQAEKDSDPSTWTKEERDAYDSGNYEEFSRLRGYTKSEIAAYRRYQNLTKQVDEKYANPFDPGESTSFGIVKAYDDVVGQDTTGAGQTTTAKSAKAAKSLPKNIFIPPVPDNQRDGQEATAALEPEELVAPRPNQRLPSLKRQIAQINRAYQEGTITAEEHAQQTRDTLELHNLRLSRQPIQPRSRGADFIRQKLLEAKRRGEISERAADLAEWFILQNPELVSSLGISIRQARRGENNISGTYSRFDRIMTLIKNTGADATTVHEIFHHLERMMPREVQEAIRTA